MSELVQIKFSELKEGLLLGKGQFGVVTKGTWNGKEVAIKRVFVADDYDYRLYFTREVDVLNKVRHPNCLRFMGISTNEKDLYIITEFVTGGNLREYLNRLKPDWGERVRIAIEMAMALDYLHRNHIIHRDVKTENVLMTKEGTVKLSDFGFSRANVDSDSSKRMTFLGSEWFEAPEIMFCVDYDERIDIFSYGLVLCEILSLQAPSMQAFKRVIPGFGLNEEEVRQRAQAGAPEAFIKEALRCSEADPDNRATLTDVIERLKVTYKEIVGKEFVDLSAGAEVPIQTTSDLIIESPSKDEMQRKLSQASVDKIDLPVQNFAKLLEQADVSGNAKGPRPPLVKGALLAMAQLQMRLDDAEESGSATDISISQEGQLQWRAFLMEFRSSIKTRDVQVVGTMRRIKTFRSCFSGTDAIDWLVREKTLMREEALEIARVLVRLAVMRSILGNDKNVNKSRFHTTLFKDAPSALYRFSDDGIFFHRERAPAYLKK